MNWLLNMYFAPSQWVHGLRQRLFADDFKAFSADVWLQVEIAEELSGDEWPGWKRKAEYARVAHRLKWSGKWLQLYALSEALEFMHGALLTAQILAPFALLIWWLAQHVTIGWH